MTDVKNKFEENEPANEETQVATDENNEQGTEEVLEGEEEIVEENGLEKQLADVTAQLEEEENRRLRLLADFENFKRRASLDKEALQKYRAQDLVTNILPVLDNFGRALAVEAKTEEAQSMMTGMEMIYRNLVEALQTEGVSEIEALDKEFDPNFHQAVMTGNDEEKASGVVLEEFQKGYMLKDRVLRPSMVKVNE